MTVTTEGSLGAKEPQEMFIDENFNKMFGSPGEIYGATLLHSHA